MGPCALAWNGGLETEGMSAIDHVADEQVAYYPEHWAYFGLFLSRLLFALCFSVHHLSRTFSTQKI